MVKLLLKLLATKPIKVSLDFDKDQKPFFEGTLDLREAIDELSKLKN
jgi:hypothetical protein